MGEHHHLDGVDTGKLDKMSTAAHVVATFRQLGSPEGEGIVTPFVSDMAKQFLRVFDAQQTEQGQEAVVAEVVTGLTQLVVSMSIGTHGEFSELVNTLMKGIAAAHARQSSLQGVTSSKQLDDIDMSKVNFKPE